MFADWLQLQNYHSGDIQGRISKDVESLVAMTTNTFPAIVTMLCQLIGAALFLCFLDYRLVLVFTRYYSYYLFVKEIIHRQATRTVQRSS